ncbi:MAG: hypothetical protein ABEN55_04460 [Bradymonadaceae bacterium]
MDGEGRRSRRFSGAAPWIRSEGSWVARAKYRDEQLPEATTFSERIQTVALTISVLR